MNETSKPGPLSAELSWPELLASGTPVSVGLRKSKGLFTALSSWTSGLAYTLFSIVACAGAYEEVARRGMNSSDSRIRNAGMLATGAIVLAEALVIFATWLSLTQRQYPLTLSMPWRQPALPLLARPLLGAFWSAHVFLGVVQMACAQAATQNASLMETASWMLFSTLWSYLAYGYIVLAGLSFSKTPAMLGFLCKARLWVSIGCGFGSKLLVPYVG